jgi:phage baseplate assembly protein W
MSNSDAHFGTDLRLLRDLERQHDRDRGRDLTTRIRPETGRVDLLTLTGVDDLRQALLLRFLTRAGELALLGHPDYGSRLHELIGEPNTETNRNRAKVFVLQALAREPRVAEVFRAEVRASRADPARIDIDLSLRAVEGGTPLNLVFPFFLDSGVGP